MPAGQDPGTRLCNLVEPSHTTALLAPKCQSFLDNLIAGFSQNGLWSLRHPPAKHINLLPQDEDFCFQLCSRLEERSQDPENQLEQIGHQAASLPRVLEMLETIAAATAEVCSGPADPPTIRRDPGRDL
jgi:hypothetical protein